jgi:hypothetical protein
MSKNKLWHNPLNGKVRSQVVELRASMAVVELVFSGKVGVAYQPSLIKVGDFHLPRSSRPIRIEFQSNNYATSQSIASARMNEPPRFSQSQDPCSERASQ